MDPVSKILDNYEDEPPEPNMVWSNKLNKWIRYPKPKYVSRLNR